MSAPLSVSPSSDGVSRTATAPGPNDFDGEAEAGEFVGARHQAIHVALVEFHDVRDQQYLPFDAGLFQRRLHALVDEALMSGVLIHDDDAVAGLRHDIGLVKLGAGRAKRAVDKVGIGLVHAGADVRRGSTDVETCLGVASIDSWSDAIVIGRCGIAVDALHGFSQSAACRVRRNARA